MMDSPVHSSVDFSTFVLELQNPQIDCGNTSGCGTNNSSRNCCPAESRLSQEFESKMQLLLSNYDLSEENDDAMAGITVLRPAYRETDAVVIGFPANDISISADKGSRDVSLESTLDNEDDPLELTGEECDDSGDAGDGGSSDEQQQSRSLSLSYSLSISHAQENFSQYSQSTDKGLSKRYDSPCSEEDRESECTNFDKLDDWNDFITDMHNNNNGENANRDFREYYDEYLASKGQHGSSTSGFGTSEEGTSDECNTKETDNACGEMMNIKKGHLRDLIEKSGDPRPDTPAFTRPTSVTEKCRTFLEYRSPASEIDDDPMTADDNSNTIATSNLAAGTLTSYCSGKRKFCYEDRSDYEYEVTEMIVEKFHKTDIVPDRGCHAPISVIDEEQFARLTQVESPSKTPIHGAHDVTEQSNNNIDNENADEYIDAGVSVLDSEEDDSAIATTPTNPNRNMLLIFRSATNDDSVLDKSLSSEHEYQLFASAMKTTRYLKTNSVSDGSKAPYVEPEITMASSSRTSHLRSNLNLGLVPK